MRLLRTLTFMIAGIALLCGCGERSAQIIRRSDLMINRPAYIELNGRAMFLVAFADGSISAFAATDTHGKDEPLRWQEQEQRFVAPRSGSQFSLTGAYILGPAPRGLDQFPVRLIGDQIVIDSTLIIQGHPRE